MEIIDKIKHLWEMAKKGLLSNGRLLAVYTGKGANILSSRYTSFFLPPPPPRQMALSKSMRFENSGNKKWLEQISRRVFHAGAKSTCYTVLRLIDFSRFSFSLRTTSPLTLVHPPSSSLRPPLPSYLHRGAQFWWPTAEFGGAKSER